MADIELEFCLATVDPSGAPTTGIIRKQTDVNFIAEITTGGQRAICYDDLGGSDAWDADEYLNIWVGDWQFLAGDASFPGTSPPEEDGIRIDPEYFGTTGTAGNNVPFHLGRTTTHEIGHYFNLAHLWGSGSGSCSSDDGVMDTPNQESTYAGDCPGHPSFSCGSQDMFMNYMTYATDGCMRFFTQGQKNRMLAALNGPRSGLLSSSGCNTSSSTQQQGSKPFVKIFPNPVRDRLILHFENFAPSMIYATFLDVSGKALIHVMGYYSSLSILDVSNYSPGVYFLKIRQGHKCLVEKIIIGK